MMPVAVFMRDNPSLKRVSESDFKEVLEWANATKKVQLRSFEGELFYTPEQLEIACMWAEKER